MLSNRAFKKKKAKLKLWLSKYCFHPLLRKFSENSHQCHEKRKTSEMFSSCYEGNTLIFPMKDVANETTNYHVN